MKTARFVIVALGILICASGCTVVHSHGWGRSYTGVAVSVPIYEVHAPHPPRPRPHVETHRHHRSRRHQEHRW